MIEDKGAQLSQPGFAVRSGPPSRQFGVMVAYTAFWLMRARLGCLPQDRLGGKAVVALGFAEAEAGTALGAILAGAAFLGVDSEQESIKRAMRRGCCDFMVNNLDEALRILKNEVRKRQPVSVGLHADVDEVLAEMIERGVRPDLLIRTINPARAAAARDRLECLRLTGSVLVDFSAEDASGEIGDAINDTIDANKLVAEWIGNNGLRAVAWSAKDGDPPQLKRLDAIALRQLPEEDQMRRRWLELAPKYFRRDSPLSREMWMSEEERERLRLEMSQGQSEGQASD